MKLKKKQLSNKNLVNGLVWVDIFMILATKGFGVKVGPFKCNFGFQWPDRASPKMANP